MVSVRVGTKPVMALRWAPKPPLPLPARSFSPLRRRGARFLSSAAARCCAEGDMGKGKRKREEAAGDGPVAAAAEGAGERKAEAAGGSGKSGVLPSMIKNKIKRTELHSKLKHEKKLEKRRKVKAREAASKRALELGEEVILLGNSFRRSSSLLSIARVFVYYLTVDFLSAGKCSPRRRVCLAQLRTPGSLTKRCAGLTTKR